MRITGGALKGRIFRTAEGPGYRPATAKVREALFSMLPARGFNFAGARVLDLFAGSGSLGYEALSRGADFVLYVESGRKAAALIRENLRALGISRPRATVSEKELPGALCERPTAAFNLAFIDPPYGKGLLAPTIEALLKGGWMAEGGFVVAEVESAVEPETIPGGGLELLTDRLYGQTRILLWQTIADGSPSTPEPSTR